MLEKLKSTSTRIVGAKQTKKVVESGRAQAVFVAKDADSHVIEPLIKACEKNSVELIYIDTMKELGQACGIEVGAAAAAIAKS